MQPQTNAIVEEIGEITHEQLVQKLSNEMAPPLTEIIQNIKNFNKKAESYLRSLNTLKYNNNKQKVLEELKDSLYKDFFNIQNQLNTYLGRKIILSYVFIDENGNREIRVSENDTTHLLVEHGTSFKGTDFVKLGYNMESHYACLKNSLPQEDNEGLQDTAKEVDRRRWESKKRIVTWNKKNGKPVGYYLRTTGPINEAYVQFYVHNIQLSSSMGVDARIGRFMLDPKYGAITADNRKGFFIGDVSKDGIQYAVKGRFGSPQGVREIIREFKKIEMAGDSPASFYSFIEKFTEVELKKQYKPQITKVTDSALNDIINRTKKLDSLKNF